MIHSLQKEGVLCQEVMEQGRLGRGQAVAEAWVEAEDLEEGEWEAHSPQDQGVIVHVPVVDTHCPIRQDSPAIRERVPSVERQ